MYEEKDTNGRYSNNNQQQQQQQQVSKQVTNHTIYHTEMKEEKPESNIPYHRSYLRIHSIHMDLHKINIFVVMK